MKQPEDTSTLDMFEQLTTLTPDNMAARIEEAKQKLARENSAASNELLINLYVASGIEMYLNYFQKLRAIIRSWGVDTRLEIPKDLPVYYTVCPVCGRTCGELTVIKQHKLLSFPCHYCEQEFIGIEPAISSYPIQEIAKHMKQSQDAVEHFVCVALMARRKAKLNVHNKTTSSGA